MQTVGKVVFSPDIVELKNLLNAAMDRIEDPAQEEFLREIANTAYWVGYYDGVGGLNTKKVKVETLSLTDGKKRYTVRMPNSKKRIQMKRGRK